MPKIKLNYIGTLNYKSISKDLFKFNCFIEVIDNDHIEISYTRKVDLFYIGSLCGILLHESLDN